MWAFAHIKTGGNGSAAQVHFAGGKHRDYLILHWPPKFNGKAKSKVAGAWWAKSLSDVTAPGNLDLRNPEHARKLEKALIE
jgi:hypothetical protein